MNRLVDAATKARRIATALEVSVHVFPTAPSDHHDALAPLRAARAELADVFGVSEVHLCAPPPADAAAWAELCAPVALQDAVCGPLLVQVTPRLHARMRVCARAPIERVANA